MDTQTIIDVWMEVGAVGAIALFFGFLLTNLIKSQSAQSKALDEIAIHQAKQEETIENLEGILLKLLTRFDKSDDKLDRKIDYLKRSIQEIDNQVSRIDGALSRNGRN